MECVEIGSARLYRGDCLEAMRKMPDKAFSLAVVDPPYGIDYLHSGGLGTDCKNKKHNRKWYDRKNWDVEPPCAEYFTELFRVSENQIIWGANYFSNFLPPSMGWVFWDKGQDLTMSDGEFAFTSFKRAARRKVINRGELNREGTIHPTQKPVKLYKWLLQNYAKEGDTILDTHLGSGSHAIAALDMGFNITAYEIDTDYFTAAVERIQRSQDQLKLAL